MRIKPIAMVIPEDKFRDEELFEPVEVWQAAGIPVTLASTRKGVITGDLGGQVETTALIDELNPADYSAIVVIGGSGAITHLWGHTGLHAKLKEFASAKRLMSSICAGSVALAQSGLLKGRSATTCPIDLMTDALRAEGVIYCQTVVIDHGDVITASGPAEAADFGRAVATALARQTL